MNLDVGQTKTLPRNYAAAVRNSKVKEEEKKKIMKNKRKEKEGKPDKSSSLPRLCDWTCGCVSKKNQHMFLSETLYLKD